MVPFNCCPIQRRSLVLSDWSLACSPYEPNTDPVNDTPLGKNATIPPPGPTPFGRVLALRKPLVISAGSTDTFVVYNPINWN